jgi:hypothetical protein
VHLDFHTSPHIRDVATTFDANEFVRTLKGAHVDSVTLFAKCHHGHFYFDTDHPARHPGLKPGFDLLAQQVEALHKHDIRAVIYISVQCDEYAANNHPDWIVINPDGTRLAPPPFTRDGATWQILDMSSPYQDYLADQLKEVLRKFHPIDGVFFDMCWTQPSCSIWAQRAMRDLGMNPADEADRAKYAESVAQQYMSRFAKMVRDAHDGKEVPVFFNGRSWTNVTADKQHLSHLEIEALATGAWGYLFFPQFVRLARPHQMPMLGMTGRFHKSWADFGGIKPEAALMYECTQMLAHGAGCSVGDQLHPRGTLDAAAYDVIGAVYKHVEACEPWCRAPLFSNEIGVFFDHANGQRSTPGGTYEGVVRALQELHCQFDFISTSQIDLETYSLLIVPESIRVNAELHGRLQRYVAKGGAILLAGDALLAPDGKPLFEQAGIEAIQQSPFSMSYFRFCKPNTQKVGITDHVMYEKGLRLVPKSSEAVIASVVEPYFERTWEHFCSHYQSPPDRDTCFAAAMVSDRVASISYPIFMAYARHGNLPYRSLISECISRLLPNPQLRVSAPSHVESTTYQQHNRQIIHLLSYAPRRRTPSIDIVEEPTACIDVRVSARVTKEPKTVHLAPQRAPVEFTLRGDRVEFALPVVSGHQIVVLE